MTNELLIIKASVGSRDLIKTKESQIIYVYKTTNLINGKIYVGVRKCPYQDVAKDTYIGCGISFSKRKGEIKFQFDNKKSPFFQAVHEFGYENFKKEILLYFDSYQDALLAEREIVDEEFVKLENTYNKIIGGGKPPTGSGEDNNNWDHRWSQEKKTNLTNYFKESKVHAGKRNGRSVPCDLYDLFEDKRYELDFIAQANSIVGDEFGSGFESIIKFRYLFLQRGEDPYEKLKVLKKSSNTFKILQLIKQGVSKEECKETTGMHMNFISRVYKSLGK